MEQEWEDRCKEQDNSGNEVASHNITQFNEAYSISFCGLYFCFFGVKTDSIIREIIDVIQGALWVVSTHYEFSDNIKKYILN